MKGKLVCILSAAAVSASSCFGVAAADINEIKVRDNVVTVNGMVASRAEYTVSIFGKDYTPGTVSADDIEKYAVGFRQDSGEENGEFSKTITLAPGLESGTYNVKVADSLYAIKRAWITIAYLDGSKTFDIYESSEWLAHFQFSPDDPAAAMFCHEGPWHLIRHGIWLFDLVKRSAVPCFRQKEGGCVDHEFWTRDAQVFFDNRRQGHDGTITSDKTSAVLKENSSEKMPYIGFADKNGNVVKTIELPFHCNHYFTNKDNTLIVGDAAEDLLLIDISGEKAEMQTLCSHNTSWKCQRTHCHPTFSWAGDKILYVSDCEGSTNIYLIENIGKNE